MGLVFWSIAHHKATGFRCFHLLSRKTASIRRVFAKCFDFAKVPSAYWRLSAKRTGGLRLLPPPPEVQVDLKSEKKWAFWSDKTWQFFSMTRSQDIKSSEWYIILSHLKTPTKLFYCDFRLKTAWFRHLSATHKALHGFFLKCTETMRRTPLRNGIWIYKRICILANYSAETYVNSSFQAVPSTQPSPKGLKPIYKYESNLPCPSKSGIHPLASWFAGQIILSQSIPRVSIGDPTPPPQSCEISDGGSSTPKLLSQKKHTLIFSSWTSIFKFQQGARCYAKNNTFFSQLHLEKKQQTTG